MRRCADEDVASIHRVINDGAAAYRGVIPADCWHEPYMTEDELRREIAHGVSFAGSFDDDDLVGVMGVQDVGDVTLVRHAYVRTARQGGGIGGALLRHLLAGSERPVLVGTWAAASWAIGFYERYGFRLVADPTRAELLRTYWTIPDRQIETSVVLADARWWAGAAGGGAGRSEPRS
jgi:GNAT superfamily N-acetyltransferase